MSRWGRALTGIHSPEQSLLRGAVMDLVQALRVGVELVGEARISRRLFYGFSYAGWLATMAQGITNRADLLAVGVPTFGWREGRRFFSLQGSGGEVNAYLARNPEAEEDVMRVLGYFDPVNVAQLIQSPTLIGWGRRDAIVPEQTVRAIADLLRCPHERYSFPISHTEEPLETLWEIFDQRVQRLALEGAPPEFGDKTPCHLIAEDAAPYNPLFPGIG
ncbi:putative Acetyl xylan esterase [Magnetofaba australis IT-1]|uniref:Putative Acetyl xylan esterase n=1 Tax=Magnetofaba australis IT-1 TaxID=1434232 RepID=A0A1Y2K6N0_9PROT|nr:putative Acetyl xylan esterase [Magnetofaba australis IT-1]